ncbi:MAG: apolipoprotein N-acyltransferase [Pseudomonadota bacterium]
MGLAQAPVSLPLVYVAALPVLFWLHGQAENAWSGFKIGWCAGLGYFAVVLFWIVEPFLVDIETHGWMAPIALLSMVAGLALFWGAAFALAAALRPEPMARVFVLASAWAFMEIARAHVFTGFPWGLLAYGWIGTPVAQALALVGPHGLDFLTMAGGLSLGLLRWRPSVVAIALFCGLAAFGTWRLSQPVAPRTDGFTVRVVQPNATQDIKWDPVYTQIFYERLLTLTAAVPEGGAAPDAVIWPETAVPFLLGERLDLQSEIATLAGPNTSVFLGIRRRETAPELPTGQVWFNSLAVLLSETGAAEHVYDKHHLVPFGEYIPYGNHLARWGWPWLTGLTGGGFEAGPGPQVLTPSGIPPFLPLICYEAIFTNLATRPGDRPDWFVQVTNDAWFGNISGPYQHLAQAQARAIEYGIPLARSANTGISAIIDPYGRIEVELALGTAGYADAPLAAPLPPTLYSRLGNAPILFISITVFLLTLSKVYSGLVRRRGQ